MEGIFGQVFVGRREAKSASFSPGLMDSWPGGSSVAPRKVSSNFSRGLENRGGSWRARRREGLAHEGPRRVGRGRRRTEPRAGGTAASQSSLLAALRAVAQRLFCLAEELPGPTGCSVTQGGWGHQRGAYSHPVGAWSLQGYLPAHEPSASLLLQTPQKSILLHPGPQPAQDRTFVPPGHPRNPFSECDTTSPSPCI